MRHIHGFFIMLLMLISVGPVMANQYDDALKAFSNKDYKRAYELSLPLAKQNHAAAQYLLAKLYYTGNGVPVNLQEGLRFHELAAKNGDPFAQFNLGALYDPDTDDGGTIVKKRDLETAMYWYEKAAQNGNPEAQFNYGVTFLSGQGKYKQDYAKAATWIRKSAEQGLIAAEVKLGLMYIYGAGVPKDISMAIHWYEIAAKAGNADAQYGLGVIYDQGDGVKEDQSKAKFWYTQAAQQGHPGAIHNLKTFK